MTSKTAVDKSVDAVSVQSAAGLPVMGVRVACDTGREFSGAVLIAELPRLAALVPRDAPDTRLDFSLHFYRNAGRDLLADVAVQTHVEIDCARCLKPLVEAVTATSVLQFVYSDEQAQHVMADCEPVLLDEDGMVSLAGMLEDEVLMAMPSFAMHPHQCRPAWQESAEVLEHEASAPVEQVAVTPVEPERPHPFAALARQWRRSDDSTDQ